MKMLRHTVVFFTLLLKAVDIRADCGKPIVGDNRVLTSEYKETYPEGSTAKFKCSVGYKASYLRADKSIKCVDGQWTVLELQCEKKSCGPLYDLSNGRYSFEEGIKFGATAIAECNDGYLLVGPKERFCRDSGWSDRDPVCEVVRCPSPPTIQNGDFEEGPYESYEYGQVVSYQCKSGFVIAGSAIILCSVDGTFQPPPPKCLKDFCEKPDIPHGIRIAGLLPPYRFKSFLRYKCEEGYKILGDDYIVCEEGEWVPPPPRCIEILCKAPDVEHAVRIPDSPQYRYKQSVQYECKSGYRLEGNDVLTCEEKGWDFAPLRCSEILCKAPDVEHAVRIPDSPQYRYKQSVQYECNSGYRLEGNDVLTCEEKGWNFAPPQCEITCKAPDVEHAVRIPDSPQYRYKQSVQYECNSGYRLEGNDVLTCEEKGWNFPPPRCSEILCKAPDVEHSVRIPDSPQYRYKQSVQYECKSGYRLEGNDVLTCEEKGWNFAPPQCDLPQYRYKQSVQHKCKSGYTVEGHSILTCQEKVWNFALPWCNVHIEILKILIGVAVFLLIVTIIAVCWIHWKKKKEKSNNYSLAAQFSKEESENVVLQ